VAENGAEAAASEICDQAFIYGKSNSFFTVQRNFLREYLLDYEEFV
jgi:hypothetical protein